MKFIEQSFEILESATNIYTSIERVARTSHNSLSRYTGKEEDAKKFVNRLIEKKHLSPLEFGGVRFRIDVGNKKHMDTLIRIQRLRNPYVYVDDEFVYKEIEDDRSRIYGFYLVITNYRVIVENNLMDLFNELIQVEEKDFITVKFTIDIATAREFLRHRTFSFCEQSTRYCNYAKHGITYIRPFWLELDKPINKQSNIQREFVWTLERDEQTYTNMIHNELPPEYARGVLPLATQTTLVMGANAKRWNKFFDIRAFEYTGKVHPMVKAISTDLYKSMVEKQLIKKR